VLILLSSSGLCCRRRRALPARHSAGSRSHDSVRPPSPIARRKRSARSLAARTEPKPAASSRRLRPVVCLISASTLACCACMRAMFHHIEFERDGGVRQAERRAALRRERAPRKPQSQRAGPPRGWVQSTSAPGPSAADRLERAAQNSVCGRRAPRAGPRKHVNLCAPYFEHARFRAIKAGQAHVDAPHLVRAGAVDTLLLHGVTDD
jgi:hypothetical protein